MWYPVTLSKAFEIKVGDLLAPRSPASENALIYAVVDIEKDGKLALISKPIHFISDVTDLVAGNTIKPEDLVDERWWYFVEE